MRAMGTRPSRYTVHGIAKHEATRHWCTFNPTYWGARDLDVTPASLPLQRGRRIDRNGKLDASRSPRRRPAAEQPNARVQRTPGARRSRREIRHAHQESALHATHDSAAKQARLIASASLKKLTGMW